VAELIDINLVKLKISSCGCNKWTNAYILFDFRQSKQSDVVCRRLFATLLEMFHSTLFRCFAMLLWRRTDVTVNVTKT